MPKSSKKVSPEVAAVNAIPANKDPKFLIKFFDISSFKILESLLADGWIEKAEYLAIREILVAKKAAAKAKREAAAQAAKVRKDRHRLRVLEAALALFAAWRKADEARREGEMIRRYPLATGHDWVYPKRSKEEINAEWRAKFAARHLAAEAKERERMEAMGYDDPAPVEMKAPKVA